MDGGMAIREASMGSNNRPLIISRITRYEKEFPYIAIHRPNRVVTFKWNQYNPKKKKWEEWRNSKHIAKCTVKKTGDNYFDWKISKPNNKSTGGYIDNLILSREEAMVYVLAHEFRHLWQKNHLGKRGKVWGARGQYPDRDADAYAIRKTREWRRLHNQSRAVNWKLIEEC